MRLKGRCGWNLRGWKVERWRVERLSGGRAEALRGWGWRVGGSGVWSVEGLHGWRVGELKGWRGKILKRWRVIGLLQLKSDKTNQQSSNNCKTKENDPRRTSEAEINSDENRDTYAVEKRTPGTLRSFCLFFTELHSADYFNVCFHYGCCRFPYHRSYSLKLSL